MASILSKPKRGDNFWYLDDTIGGRLGVSIEESRGDEFYEDFNCFNIIQTQEIAHCISDAFNVQLELMHCEGSEQAQNGISQWTIEFMDGEIFPQPRFGIEQKLSVRSPCFATVELAQQAIYKIGADRILRAFKAMQGIYE